GASPQGRGEVCMRLRSRSESAEIASSTFLTTTVRLQGKFRRPTCKVHATSPRSRFGFSFKCAARLSVARSTGASDRAESTSRCAARWDAFDVIGGGCSITTCAFVPPTPKALIPARRGTSSVFHSDSLVLTRKGLFSRSKFLFGAWKWSVGGKTP